MDRHASTRTLCLGIGVALFSALLTVGTADAKPGFATRTATQAQLADVLTKKDIERARGSYALQVPGKGTLYVKQLRAAGGGTSCRVHRPSLIDKLASEPSSPDGPSWVQVGLVKIPEELGGGTLCIGDGKGCYLLVSKTAGD